MVALKKESRRTRTKMINVMILSAIGKFTDPNLPEDITRNHIEEPDYLFRIAILPESIIGYEEYIPNPEHPYYQYKGPIIKILLTEDYERMCLISFDEFNQLYQKAMEFKMANKLN